MFQLRNSISCEPMSFYVESFFFGSIFSGVKYCVLQESFRIFRGLWESYDDDKDGWV